MKTTKVFGKNISAYNQGYRIIANKGGSRSSKTFSIEQLLYIIMTGQNKSRVITVVSHSLPHLEGGAIRDFDNILMSNGIPAESVRTKRPYVYNIHRSLLEFVGFDKPGKALGAARDILFVNEANKMPFSIVHQLMQRTREVIFLDWNPAAEFWFQSEGLEDEPDTIVLNSTFQDNINNLTQGQINDFKRAEQKALKEDTAGRRGYWYNWWQVYGLGKQGQLEGVIFQDTHEYDELPYQDFYKMFVVDWGGNDPTTLTELNFSGNDLYIREHLYKPQILNTKLIDLILKVNPEGHEVVCDSARKDKIYELQMAGINAFGATKGEGSIIDGIEKMQEFNIFIHKDSHNAKYEFSHHKWAQDKHTGKSLNKPEDKDNHIIDATRYGTRFYRMNIKPM